MAGEPSDMTIMTSEMLRRVRGQFDRIEGDVQKITVRMTRVESGLDLTEA